MAVLTNAQILTSIASSTKVTSLKDFITNHQNLEVFGNLITSDAFQGEKNALLGELVNGISKQIVNSKIMKNQLAELKSGKIPYGSQIEEIIANPATGTPYNMSSADLLTQTYPDVKAVYYKINRQDKYPVTISDVQLQRALINANSGLNDLVQMVIGSLYSGDNLDEMRYTKELIGSAVLNNRVKKIIVGATSELAGITDPSPSMTIGTIDLGTAPTQNSKMKQIAEKIRELYYNFPFGSTLYNGFVSVKQASEKELTTACEPNDQLLLLRTDILASTDIELLSTAFNMDKVNFMQKVLPVDDFNGFDVIGILVDKKWFRIEDSLYTIREFQNGSNLTANYWLHHHQIISYNLLANAVIFINATDKSLNNV